MSLVTVCRDMLAKSPRLDGMFRRHVWSRLSFPEGEMRFLSALPRGSIDIAIDVGAAHGSYSWILDRKSQDVYSFEPGEQHGDYLAKTIGGSRVKLVRAAVGNAFGQVKMYTPGDDTNALHTATLSVANPVAHGASTRVRIVDQVTLDGYFVDKLDTGRHVDLLKVDVEGYEMPVFEGALALLERHHPLVMCEIEARHNAEYGRVFGLLRALGYQCFILRNSRYERFDDLNIEGLQTDEDLVVRLSRDHDPVRNRYINNFVFQHPASRIKVSS